MHQSLFGELAHMSKEIIIFRSSVLHSGYTVGIPSRFKVRNGSLPGDGPGDSRVDVGAGREPMSQRVSESAGQRVSESASQCVGGPCIMYESGWRTRGETTVGTGARAVTHLSQAFQAECPPVSREK